MRAGQYLVAISPRSENVVCPLLFGDQVLVHIADILGHCCRAGDTVARWGGEEFLFLLPSTDAEQAEEFAERVCASVARQPLRREGHDDVACTLSLGVAGVSENETLTEALARADTGLYQSKTTGRNRVTATCAEFVPSALPEREITASG